MNTQRLRFENSRSEKLIVYMGSQGHKWTLEPKAKLEIAYVTNEPINTTSPQNLINLHLEKEENGLISLRIQSADIISEVLINGEPQQWQ